jgi:hypothetical protein
VQNKVLTKNGFVGKLTLLVLLGGAACGQASATPIPDVEPETANVAQESRPAHDVATPSTPIAPTASNAAPTSNTVAATQSGPWTVGISGTPSVSLAPGASVAATLDPSGNTVQVGNTVNVALANTPTVNVGTLPPVTGTVAVTSMPSVTIANSSTAPIPIVPTASTKSLGSADPLITGSGTSGTSQAIDVSSCRTLRVTATSSNSDYHLRIDAYSDPNNFAGNLVTDLVAVPGDGMATTVLDTPGAYIKLTATSATPNVFVWYHLFCRP